MGMPPPRATDGFWETTGAAKTFTHPIDPGLLAEFVPRSARVLDYGCGYGRLTAELVGQGYRAVRGVDRSAALIARGRRENPGLALMRWAGFPLPFADRSFDAALLFAVLTCVPDDAGQRAIVGELARLVRPGGVLYVSDVPLRDDPFNRERYGRFAARYGTYGVFETEDGGVFRHHAPTWLRGLLRAAGFTVLRECRATVPTPDGRTAERLQIMARREPAGPPEASGTA
ncbi:class I SAM-dependent methyltransferase [Streptomyces sp. NPDC057579]|uniref:class I SAM-dependent methyltransferase n=1 Tax=unclassified Streptomyces TaxID=2593676 RepID=UPI0036AA8BF9